ncbi:hypothetical protein Tco_0825433 [Tanacetum coccineum]
MPVDPYDYIMAAYQVPPSPDYIPGPEVPPSPDYILGPEEPRSPPLLEFVLELMYPEFTVYVPKSDPEEEPKGGTHEDHDGRHPDEDEAREKEHLAPADSVPPIHRMTARISIRDEPSISLPHREEIPSPPLPRPSPPPNSPTHIEIPESCLPLWKRVRFASPTLSHEVGESSVAGAARQDGPAVPREDPYSIARGDLYGLVDMVDVAPGHLMSRELDYGITDTWDDLGTRNVHSSLAVMIEERLRLAREAWGLSMDASDYACSDVMSLRTMGGTDKSKITRKQSKASKHGHENQKSTKRSQRSQASAQTLAKILL